MTAISVHLYPSMRPSRGAGRSFESSVVYLVRTEVRGVTRLTTVYPRLHYLYTERLLIIIWILCELSFLFIVCLPYGYRTAV